MSLSRAAAQSGRDADQADAAASHGASGNSANSGGGSGARNERADRGERQRDAERTRAEILDVATAEFAHRGYAGARVDEIAARTRTTKRMIYYYYGGKEQLYIAVLERAYTQIRAAEQQLDVAHMDPVAAIRRLAEVTFDHHEAYPHFIELVSIENTNRAEHLMKSTTLRNLATPVLDLIAEILAAGREQGIFVAAADALDIHMMISSFCVFRVANRHTFGTIFGRDLTDPALREHYRRMIGDAIVAYLTTPEPGAAAAPR